MSIEILTKDDLAKFKSELIDHINKAFSNQHSSDGKELLKSSEVRKMLKISSKTLQNLRINGTLPYTKLGGVIYYSHKDILKMLDEHKQT